MIQGHLWRFAQKTPPIPPANRITGASPKTTTQERVRFFQAYAVALTALVIAMIEYS
jgi:hypothetical protein